MKRTDQYLQGCLENLKILFFHKNSVNISVQVCLHKTSQTFYCVVCVWFIECVKVKLNKTTYNLIKYVR